MKSSTRCRDCAHAAADSAVEDYLWDFLEASADMQTLEEMASLEDPAPAAADA